MTTDETRRYRLISHPPYGVYTEVLPSGQQLLVGRSYNAILAIFCDAQGQFLSRTKRVVIDSTRVPLDFTPDEDRQFQEALTSYLAQVQFEEAPITVQAFFIGGVGIEDLPTHYQDFLADPASVPVEEHEYYRPNIEQWLKRGDFVFFWGND